MAALVFSATAGGYAQTLATLEVKLDAPRAGLEIPVQVALDPITHLPDDSLALFAIKGKDRISVPFQVDGSAERTLMWLVNDDARTLRFELVRNRLPAVQIPVVQAVAESGALTLQSGSRNFLRYHSGLVYPPAGVDPVFTRSGFIHPLWAPRGQVLTRIHAPDHYHHFGVWNPWTHVLYEGDTVDFWNLNARQGTVRFGGFISTVSGNVFGGYSALHQHVAFRKGEEQLVIQELQSVRIYATARQSDYYVADITVQLNCAGKPVRLLEYRYGGLGWRATEQWTKENSRVLTSEGKTRRDADGSRAQWCIVEGNVDGENAGIVMMSHPANYNHPEPLRIWPENANGNRGDMFANFSPTKDMDWPLEPGKNYLLRYRFVVFSGGFTKEKAAAAWTSFATPPRVTVIQKAR